MSKEQIIDDAYRKYADSHCTPPSNPKGKLLSDELFSVIPMEHSKESFINKCKIDSKFSEKWGLKIEERELSREERYVWYKANTHLIPPHFRNQAKEFEDKYVPTKLITLEYNGTKIEVYE